MESRVLHVSIAALVVVCAHATAQGRFLQKSYLTDHSSTLCNDGSPASFYYSPSPNKTSGKWLVYLEGGGFCVDVDTCWYRHKNQKYWTTSNAVLFPEIIEGTDILSADDSNPFSDFHHVYIPYCSSDLWLSNIPQRLTLHENVTFYFNGGSVFRAVMDELENLGLNDDSTLVLAGSSAGAIGAANHAVRLRREGRYPNIALLVDSGWFIDHDQVFTNLYEKGEYNLTEDICREATHDLSILSCCVTLECVFERHVSNLQIPTFVVTSATDTFEFGAIVQNIIRHPKFDFSNPTNDLSVRLNFFAGALNASLGSTHFSHVSVFQAGCGQHGYFRNIPLWGSVISGGNEFTISTQGITQSYSARLRPGYWQSVVTGGASLHSMLSKWLSSGYSHQRTWETCSGFLCNPSCPDTLRTGLDQESISKALEALFLLLAIAVLATPATFKIILFMSAFVIRIKWKRHLGDDTLDEETGNANLNLESNGGVPKESSDWRSGRRRTSFRRCRPSAAVPTIFGLIQGHTLQLACKDLVCTVPIPKVSERRGNIDAGDQPDQLNGAFTKKRKIILDNVTMELKTGELVGIMGPSGSGKTTLLHVLANRTQGYEIQGNILLNGRPLKENDRKYQRQCGMVQQLSKPYFDELTVRENLFFSAIMRMDKNSTLQERVDRVEAVLTDVGMSEIADTVVEDSNGKGISGGQKRRLSVVIQLLHVPTILFLDEPTSGLDATSSLELLTTLSRVTKRNRLVVLTIHQPRQEIFNMFDKLLLLAAGKVVFLGCPADALSFINSSHENDAEQIRSMQTATDNPADTILDLLSTEKYSHRTSKKFDSTLRKCQNQNINIVVASKTIAGRLISSMLMSSMEGSADNDPIKTATEIRMRDDQKESALSWFNQLLAMELRLVRQKWLSTDVFYAPVGLGCVAALIGVLYWQSSQTVPIFALLSLETSVGWYVMSAVALTLLVPRGIHLYHLERADGVCQPWQFVLHSYAHLVSIAIIPTAIGTTIVCFMAIDATLTASNIAWAILFILLAESWIIAYMILAICLAPKHAAYFSNIGTMVCSIFQGFLVPRPGLPVFLRWVSYINPIAWAFAGAVQGLLKGKTLPCDKDSPLSCTDKNFNMLISQFGLEAFNPYIGLVFLVLANIVMLSLSIAAFLPWKKYTAALRTRLSSAKDHYILFQKSSSVEQSTLESQHVTAAALLSEVCAFTMSAIPSQTKGLQKKNISSGDCKDKELTTHVYMSTSV